MPTGESQTHYSTAEKCTYRLERKICCPFGNYESPSFKDEEARLSLDAFFLQIENNLHELTVALICFLTQSYIYKVNAHYGEIKCSEMFYL